MVLVVLLLFLSVAGRRCVSQVTAPAPASNGCNGILLSYQLDSREQIRPFVANPADQPYKFSATAAISNAGAVTLKDWSLLVKYAHREILVSVSNAVLTSTVQMPYNTSLDGGATSFSGYPNTDLLTAIATAGDASLTTANITIVGTLFAPPDPPVPLPTSISLGDPSYDCPPAAAAANSANLISTCCIPKPNYNATTNLTDSATVFLPRRSGDLSITYDIIQSYPTNYLALVTVENHAKLGRLDNWQLSWEWKRQEFIYSMKGAYPSVVDVNDCIYGKQGRFYEALDFSKALSCKPSPVILDLPLSKFNDTEMGKIPYCCRNGTILPDQMDPKQSKSAFYMSVYKMPPDLNRTAIFPPANWKIVGSSGLNPDYACGQPIRVAPTTFPDPSGLQSNTTAIATWQIICNITTATKSVPKCCVTFSAFYNSSVIPCSTCACGCPQKTATCSSSAPAMLLPPEALLVPFENRTKKALAWAEINRFNVPSPLPCNDYCGVSINWHIATDYSNGWSARITMFNWDQVDLADWFAAIEMDKAYDGYQQMYSFNTTATGNGTVLMWGLPGLNYLVKLSNATNPTDEPMVPGKQQSVISFTKKPTPGINIVAGDGFPSKVYFNGDECAMPTSFPISSTTRPIAHLSSIFTAVILPLALLAGLL